MAFGFQLTADTGRMFAALDAYEVTVVARTVAHAERLHLDRFAKAATRLGNGWLYPIVTLMVLLARIDEAVRFLASATASLAIAFLVYPMLKRFLARSRPCDYDPSLARAPEPLDHYSCPSGHAMTAAAYGVSLIAAAPVAAALALAICAIVGWSRVALGHHYVSDVLLGTVFGSVVATGVAAFLY